MRSRTASSGLNIITSMIDSHGTNASPNCGYSNGLRLDELQVDAAAPGRPPWHTDPCRRWRSRSGLAPSASHNASTLSWLFRSWSMAICERSGSASSCPGGRRSGRWSGGGIRNRLVSSQRTMRSTSGNVWAKIRRAAVGAARSWLSSLSRSKSAASSPVAHVQAVRSALQGQREHRVLAVQSMRLRLIQPFFVYLMLS